MTTKATHANCHEAEVHRFVAEASTLGLRPGEWPRAIDTDLGNGRPFYATGATRDDEGGLIEVQYLQELGCITLHVLND